jgi:hypothetical protein
VFGAGIFYCRCGCGIRFPGIGDEIPGCRCQQGALLRCGQCVRFRILAVCSCTILPLFAGIWKRGAGLGPAIAFLYSGPAINVLAIILTARILGPEIGMARAVGAIIFSIVIGLFMHLMFRKEEEAKAAAAMHMPEPEVERPLWQTTLLFAAMVGLLVSATWGKPEQAGGFWSAVFAVKWLLAGGFRNTSGHPDGALDARKALQTNLCCCRGFDSSLAYPTTAIDRLLCWFGRIC